MIQSVLEFFKNYFVYDKFNSEISSELIIKGKANSFNEVFETMEGEGEIQFKKNLIKGSAYLIQQVNFYINGVRNVSIKGN